MHCLLGWRSSYVVASTATRSTVSSDATTVASFSKLQSTNDLI